MLCSFPGWNHNLCSFPWMNHNLEAAVRFKSKKSSVLLQLQWETIEGKPSNLGKKIVYDVRNGSVISIKFHADGERNTWLAGDSVVSSDY
jgi:hypothetical protein